MARPRKNAEMDDIPTADTIPEDVLREAMDKVRAESEALRAEFVKLMNEDTESFNVFMAAMKMPKAARLS